MLICCLLGVGVALVCENVCYYGVAKTALAAGHGALRISVNAEQCKEIYDRLQTPGIKHNAKLWSACLNQTHNPSSCHAHFPSPCVSPTSHSSAMHLSSLLTSLSALFVS